MDNPLDALDAGSGAYFSWGSQAKSWKIDGTECQLTGFMIEPTSIKTGYGKLGKNETPDWVWAEIPGTKMTPPSEDHKVAVYLDVYVTEADGAPSEGWKPWATNARASREAIKSIWAEIHSGAVKNKGKVAVVKVTGSKSKEFGPAVVNVPVLELIRQRTEPTVSLALTSIVFAVILAVTAGVLAAWKPGSVLDAASTETSELFTQCPCIELM